MTDLPSRLTSALADRYRIERLLAEIETTANLQHPHILPLHWFEELKARMGEGNG